MEFKGQCWRGLGHRPTATQLREAKTVTSQLRVDHSLAGSSWGLLLVVPCFHHSLPPFDPLCS